MTGAVQLTKSLRLPTTGQHFVHIEIDQQIAARIACMGQQMCMSGYLAARLLLARLQHRFDEAREDIFV
jgi:hypothetical protein